MRYVVALFLPWLTFFTMGKFLQGILCLLLQMTFIGWLPATIWAFAAVGGYHADKRTDRLVHAMEAKQASAQPVSISPRSAPERNPAPRRPESSKPIPSVESYLRSVPKEPAPKNVAADELPSRRESVRAPSAPARSYDERKWRALVRFDDDISAAAKHVRAFGAEWEDELASAYLRLNDKSHLDAIVARIAYEARTSGA